MRFSFGESKGEMERVEMAMAMAAIYPFFPFVFTLITFIGRVLLMNNEGSRLLGGGDLGVVVVRGKLGEAFGERSKLALTNKLSTIAFPSLIDTIRKK
jgi:hypothetical protein